MPESALDPGWPTAFGHKWRATSVFFKLRSIRIRFRTDSLWTGPVSAIAVINLITSLSIIHGRIEFGERERAEAREEFSGWRGLCWIESGPLFSKRKTSGAHDSIESNHGPDIIFDSLCVCVSLSWRYIYISGRAARLQQKLFFREREAVQPLYIDPNVSPFLFHSYYRGARQ